MSECVRTCVRACVRGCMRVRESGICARPGTFALWGVLAAVPQDVDLVHRPVGLKQLLQLLLRPGARDLAHEHLDGVRVRLVGVLERAVHLARRAVTAGGERRGEEGRGGERHVLKGLVNPK